MSKSNQYNENGEKYGLWVEYYFPPFKIKKYSEINYKYGEMHGLVTYWHLNGRKEYEKNYKNGEQHGLYTEWHENGQKKSEQNYKYGVKHGLVTLWYENGQKKTKVNYKDYKKDGLETCWRESGQKKSQKNYKNNEDHGLTTLWHENRQKKAEINFKDGKKHGLATFWNENGQKQSEVNYENGKESEFSLYDFINDNSKQDTQENNLDKLKNMDKKDFYKDIENILAGHNITKLYHFTHKKNVDSILEKGLFSWNHIENNEKSFPLDVKFGGNDISRNLDYEKGLQDYVRLSFIPNHPMLLSKWLAEHKCSYYCILEIDIEAIYLQDNKYSNMNATDNDCNCGDKLSDFENIDFDNIKKRLKNKFHAQKDELGNQEIQAEVLVKTHLPEKYIKDTTLFSGW